MTRQILHIADLHHERDSAPTDPTFLGSRRMYAIGSLGGGIVPFGDEHLIGRMGGIWAHPLRVLAGWQLAVASGVERHSLTEADECIVAWSHLERRWHEPLPITWREWLADDQHAVAYVELSIHNPQNEAWHGSVSLAAVFDLRPCWFGGVAAGPTIVRTTAPANVVQATTAAWDDGWGAALGADPSPHGVALDGQQATLRFELHLAAGATQTVCIALVAEHERGADGALHALHDALLLGPYRLQRRQQQYTALLTDGVCFNSPDAELNTAWQLAKVNLRALEANYPPALGSYFLAGLPEYPQLFGCDTTYSVVGALAAGFTQTTLSAIEMLADVAWRQCGRVPHELTTNGRVFNPGNIQETPQFTLAAWDAVCWTGDRTLLQRLYPLCREGVREYIIAGHGWAGTPYLWGDGMIERHGMGAFKLDVQCYTIRALQVLGEMAAALGDEGAAAEHRAAADAMQAAFEADWWMPEPAMYADSRHSRGANQLDGHWTTVLPVRLGIAHGERATRIIETVRANYVNEWGLMHTHGADERVWTLPTALLALTLFRHGHAEDAVRLLRSIAATTRVGLLGAFEELIPQGLCFVQLWSAALLIEGIVGGLLGVQPRALDHTLQLAPCLPADWDGVELRNLRIGNHRIDLCVYNDYATVRHHDGDAPLTVIWRDGPRTLIPPGDEQRVGIQGGDDDR